jgi:L-alanine-DL-glutamate epimerase-like enolase superfamily enzyme
MPVDSPRIERVETSVYSVPTDAPEADGTFAWDRTSLVLAQVTAGGRTGLGYSYTGSAAVDVLKFVLTPVLLHQDAFAIPKLWKAMIGAVRNIGWRGVCASAISAVDVALWDLKARLLDLPLVQLFGSMSEAVPIYGSGGFTTYSDHQLAGQLGTWVREDGCSMVKMKIGGQPDNDPHRMRVAREAIGPDVGLMIDANGALERKQAISMADLSAGLGVIWFEEPVSSDDVEGLRLVRGRAPGGMEIAAGEYGYEPIYFNRMMAAGAVDVIQADATRCCGYSGFLAVAALADAHQLPLSAHTAPSLHLPVCCALARLRHIEWFHDHVRIEQLLFDGAPKPVDGMIRPDLSRPGHGLTFRHQDAKRFLL